MSKSWSAYCNEEFYNSFGHAGMTHEQKVQNMFNNSQHDYVAMAKVTSYITGTIRWAWDKLFG